MRSSRTPTSMGRPPRRSSTTRRSSSILPTGLSADRGVHSPETEATLTAAGVKRVAIPASGKLSEERRALEHTRRWKRGYRWRAGIEGRIASLRRDYGWRKSAYHGQDGMERWLGLGVMVSNLRRIALTKGK